MSLSFDLEQDILKCWNITDDIREILDDAEYGKIDQKEMVQALRAYRQVYQRRFQRCFERFEGYNRESWEWKHRALALEKELDSLKTPGGSMGKKVKSKAQKEVDH